MRAPILNAVQFRRARTSSTSRRGFTIIELLATMSLIALLSALAVPHYSHLTERARVAKAVGDIQAMRSDILSQDSLPASLATINRQSLIDPWGHPYIYEYPGKRNPSGYDLISAGPDGQMNTGDDITNGGNSGR